MLEKSSPLAFQWSTAFLLAHFFGDEPHEVHDMLGLAGEFLTQLRILGGYANWAGIEMAHAHHDAAGGYKRRGGETEFFGTE